MDESGLNCLLSRNDQGGTATAAALSPNPVERRAKLRISVENAAGQRYQGHYENGRLGDSRPAKISMLLTADKAVQFEAYCENRGHKKSTLIARLVREHLDREQFSMQAELFCSKGARRKGP